jgi:hypothetical protein
MYCFVLCFLFFSVNDGRHGTSAVGDRFDSNSNSNSNDPLRRSE